MQQSQAQAPQWTAGGGDKVRQGESVRGHYCLWDHFQMTPPLSLPPAQIWLYLSLPDFGRQRANRTIAALKHKMMGVSRVILFTYEVERTLLRRLWGYDCCYQFSHCTRPTVAFNYHRLRLQIQTQLPRPPETLNTFKRKSIHIRLFLYLHIQRQALFLLLAGLPRPFK